MSLGVVSYSRTRIEFTLIEPGLCRISAHNPVSELVLTGFPVNPKEQLGNNRPNVSFCVFLIPFYRANPAVSGRPSASSLRTHGSGPWGSVRDREMSDAVIAEFARVLQTVAGHQVFDTAQLRPSGPATAELTAPDSLFALRSH